MITDLFIGLAIGDAYGAGLEFQDRKWMRKNVTFEKFINARNRIQVSEDKIDNFTKNYNEWDYTDDTEMTIAVIKAIMSTSRFSSDLLVKKWQEEYNLGIKKKGHGRNGHGSMAWYYSGLKSIEEIRDFQRLRPNPGNAPAMRSIPLGFLPSQLINDYAAINSNATHPNIIAVLSSQCIARATEHFLVNKGDAKKVISYCFETIKLNDEYSVYLKAVDKLPPYNQLKEEHFTILCGSQPIKPPYFLSGINGLPSDSKYTAGSVLYVLKHSTDAFDALKKSILLGGDVDSVASLTTGIMAGLKGLINIPSFMLNQVEGKDYVEQIAMEFENFLFNKNYI